MILTHPTYTILIPNDPTAMAVYCHANNPLPHSNGKVGRTKYNYQAEIVHRLAIDMPNAIVAVATYDIRAIRAKLIELKDTYGISRIAVGGWSLGGNNALRLASDLNADVILMDSNHTNKVADIFYESLCGNRCEYVSNNINATKLNNISKAKHWLNLNYRVIQIPTDFNGSNHRYCRDWTLENGIYNEVLYGRVR